ncbi:MAG: adenylate cyclase [Deltaproteobacteria bacterium]|nr:adenylate cyclase [Deltaproteobacteria bacterium]
MSPASFHGAVLFADISGSTRLYEVFGNHPAQEIIDHALSGMTRVAERHGGTLVKTIGDEIMVRFPSADQAVRAAIDIQMGLRDGDIDAGHPLQVQIGLQYGPMILQHGDLFGDSVNVAARVRGIAKGGQIITTRDTVEALSPALAARTRLFDVAAVKGKAENLVIYEVLWDEENVTRIIRVGPSLDVGHRPHTLTLLYEELQKRVDAGSTVTLGRAGTCDLVVLSPLASRIHARIEYRRGKFILLDQSTNGTYVLTADGKEVFLRREELPLWGTGFLSLGEPAREGAPHRIAYSA